MELWAPVLKNERGSVLVSVALAMVALLGLAAVVVDGGMLWQTRQHMIKSADAGALAGAQLLAMGESDQSAVEAAEAYLAFNDIAAEEITGVEILNSPQAVRVTVRRNVDLSLAAVMGFNQAPVTATATATYGAVVAADGNIIPLMAPVTAFHACREAADALNPALDCEIKTDEHAFGSNHRLLKFLNVADSVWRTEYFPQLLQARYSGPDFSVGRASWNGQQSEHCGPGTSSMNTKEGCLETATGGIDGPTKDGLFGDSSPGSNVTGVKWGDGRLSGCSYTNHPYFGADAPADVGKRAGDPAGGEGMYCLTSAIVPVVETEEGASDPNDIPAEDGDGSQFAAGRHFYDALFFARVQMVQVLCDGVPCRRDTETIDGDVVTIKGYFPDPAIASDQLAGDFTQQDGPGLMKVWLID